MSLHHAGNRAFIAQMGRGMRVSESSRRPVGRAALDPLKKRWLKFCSTELWRRLLSLKCPWGLYPETLV